MRTSALQTGHVCVKELNTVAANLIAKIEKRGRA